VSPRSGERRPSLLRESAPAVRRRNDPLMPCRDRDARTIGRCLRRVLLEFVERFFEQVDADMVKERGEPLLPPFPRDFPYALQQAQEPRSLSAPEQPAPAVR
jgi:hypothetical protein